VVQRVFLRGSDGPRLEVEMDPDGPRNPRKGISTTARIESGKVLVLAQTGAEEADELLFYALRADVQGGSAPR
jgi:hypothetical protein